MQKELENMKEDLREENLIIESDLKRLDKKVAKENELFKCEFKHDMDELGKSIKYLFKDEVK